MAMQNDKSYRNVLREIGISQKEIDERLDSVITTFFYDETERI